MAKNKFGFTLIEIIVVVGVITTLFGMSIASYNDFNEQKKLEAEAEKLVSTIELVKKNVTSGKSSNYNDCDGYVLRLSSVNNYLVCEECSSNINRCNNADISQVVRMVNYTIPNDVKVELSSSLSTWTFKKALNTTGAITVKNINNNSCLEVSFTNPGLVTSIKKTCP